MAKKFMYVCFGMLALTVVFHLGARYGSASIVDHSTTGIVASTGGVALMDNGEVWYIDDNVGWARSASYDPPVPVSEIKFWNRTYLVTTSNEMWANYFGVWQYWGQPPGLVAAQPTTWGQIKAEFAE